jgi:hypothetical protein
MSIQQNVLAANKLAFENADSKTLALIVDMNQLYIEYLDELETAPLETKFGEVTVKVDGKTIRFRNVEDFSSWITSSK